MNHITPKITGPSDEGRIKTGVFAINNKKDNAKYEEIVNDEDCTIIKKYPPTIDKAGRAIVIIE